MDFNGLAIWRLGAMIQTTFGLGFPVEHRQPISNPKTQLYDTDLNEVSSENTGEHRTQRGWWWRVRSALGWLPKRQATDRDLRLALRSEDADEVMRLLEEGVVPSRYPDTPWLCLAARRQNTVLLDLLLIHGARVDQEDRETRGAKGRTALHEAAKLGWSKGARLLLDAAADPNRLDGQGLPPLHQAVRRGHADVVRLLLEAGAQVRDGKGQPWPFLHEATTPEVVDLLVHAGLPVDALDARGFPALHQQVKIGRAAVVERLLFHRVFANVLDRQGRTAAFWLGKGQAKECLKALLAGGLDLALADSEGSTAAHVLPLRTRDEEVLAEVYRRQPSVWKIKNQQGETPLFILARAGGDRLAKTFEADMGKPGA